jgi:outer membrane receptor protein involved in Fe transport
VGTTPVLGAAVPLEKVPANVEVVGRGALERDPTQPLASILARELTSGSVTDSQGNPFSTTLNLRGYSVSPVLGAPQGVAVYQNGQRLNDPFGDVVSWAVLPSFAAERVEVTAGASPVFGLNSLGGAAALSMKDGFSAPGARLTARGGSWGSAEGTAELGRHSDTVAFYGGVSALHDRGWRHESPSNVFQAYLDLAGRGESLAGGVSLALADADLTGNGAAPVQLLDDNYRAVFTHPDENEQRLYNVNARASWELAKSTGLQGIAYFRRSHLDTRNGDDADFAPCTSDPGVLCSDAGGPDEELLVDRGGTPIPASADVSATLNRTETLSQSYGASLQLLDQRDVFARANRLSVGAALDLGSAGYATDGEAGRLDQSRGVDGLGLFLGGDAFNTDLSTHNRALGAYFSDLYALTPSLSATFAGRLNVARVSLQDLDGESLDGAHRFQRFNPAVGLTYEWSPSAQGYASYGESNRIPTPAELGCADPEQPCRVPNAFTADPPLDQVVSRTVELGARGLWLAPFGSDSAWVRWSVAGYSGWNHDDILFVASGPVLGSGYFANAGETRRLGFEARARGEWAGGSWFVSYGYVQATFGSRLAIASPDNPGADANGLIHVRPGDRIPNIPQHTVKAGVAYRVTDSWTAAIDGEYASSRPYQGDEANLIDDVPDYSILNVETSYLVRPGMSVRLRIENLFDQRYYTSGVLGDPSRVFPSYNDPRFLTPGAPFTVELACSLEF